MLRGLTPSAQQRDSLHTHTGQIRSRKACTQHRPDSCPRHCRQHTQHCISLVVINISTQAQPARRVGSVQCDCARQRSGTLWSIKESTIPEQVSDTQQRPASRYSRSAARAVCAPSHTAMLAYQMRRPATPSAGAAAACCCQLAAAGVEHTFITGCLSKPSYKEYHLTTHVIDAKSSRAELSSS
jgi:hypothetical protein